MRVRRFAWADPAGVATAVREWAADSQEAVEVQPTRLLVRQGGDSAILELTARFDAPENPPEELRVDPAVARAALEGLDPKLRLALDTAAANIHTVAEAQLGEESKTIELPQGQSVEVRDVPVRAVGISAPGGRAAYASTVLMCCIPAKV